MIRATKNAQIIDMLTGERLPVRQSNGYNVVYYNNKMHYVHRLIAADWLDGYSSDKCVIFRDGDKSNCSLDNLMLLDKCELSENERASYFPFVYQNGNKWVVRKDSKYYGSFDSDIQAYELCAKKLSGDNVRDILDGRYLITDDGVIYNKDKGMWLSCSRSDGKITIEGKRYSIGLLVYNAFNSDKAMRIFHKNGLKYDNKLLNLAKIL